MVSNSFDKLEGLQLPGGPGSLGRLGRLGRPSKVELVTI